MNFKEFFKNLDDLSKINKSFVCVTFVEDKGHAPQDSGAKMLVSEQGLYWGTIGGGKIENKCIQEAMVIIKEASKNFKNKYVKWNLQKDVGMSCGGEVVLFFEYFNFNTWPIYIFGAGHVAQALVHQLLLLDCNLYLCDDRQEWLDKLPKSSKLNVYCENYIEFINKIQFTDSCQIVVMTRGHQTDFPILKEILRNNYKYNYIGVLGSSIKSLKIKSELKEAGVLQDKIEKLRCPMGYDFGSNQPNEIALSISAELLRFRDLISAETKTVNKG